MNRGAKEGKPIDLDDARDSGAIGETADHLWTLYRPDEALAPIDMVGNRQYSGVMILGILKSRSGGKGRIAKLQSDMLTQVVVEEGGQDAMRARQNVKRDAEGWTYKRLREHRPQQFHLDVTVDGVDKVEPHVLALGAVKHAVQPGEAAGDQFRVTSIQRATPSASAGT